MRRPRPSLHQPLRSHPSRPPLNRLRRQRRQHRLRQHHLRQHHLQRIQSRRLRHRHLRQHPVLPPRLAFRPRLKPESNGNPRLLRQARLFCAAPQLPPAVRRLPRKLLRPRCLPTTLRLPSRPQWRKSLRPRQRRLRWRHRRLYRWQSNLHQHPYRRPPRLHLARRRTDFGARLRPVI